MKLQNKYYLSFENDIPVNIPNSTPNRYHSTDPFIIFNDIFFEFPLDEKKRHSS